MRLNYILLKEAVRKGAQAIVTVCPLCQYNLDAYQAEIRRQTRELLDVPTLYFTQILAWALGGDERALGLQRAIAGRKLIAQWFMEKTRRWLPMSKADGAIRIGVYTCHCGTNIAGTVDVKRLAEQPSALPRGGFAGVQIHVLRSRPGTHPAGHRGPSVEQDRGGLVFAAPARAHLPHRNPSGRAQSILLPHGQHSRACVVGSPEQSASNAEAMDLVRAAVLRWPCTSRWRWGASQSIPIRGWWEAASPEFTPR